jgi:phosphoglycerate dehydrogenase-like enzyme
MHSGLGREELSMTTVAFIARTQSGEMQQRWQVLQRVAPKSVQVRLVDAGLSEGELMEALKDVDAIIPWWGRGLPPQVVKNCPKLKLVQLLSAGYDAYDVAALKQMGIAVANNGGSNAVSVSEHTVALMLSVCRRMMDAWENTRNGKWRDGTENLPLRSEITGKTVGIIGFGNIGRQVARKLGGWDVRLLYYDIIEPTPGRELENGARYVPKDELLRQSDIVTLHVPLNKSTRGMMSDREFGLMKKSAVLINACRGPVVDEKALIRALQQGKIAAAGLDVLEQEPTDPKNPLLKMPNAVVTPHWAGGTAEGSERAFTFAVANCVRLAEGRPLLSVVHPED